MHTVFQNESITGQWIHSLSFVDAKTGEEVAENTVRITGAYTREVDGRLAAWIDMAVAPDPGRILWIGAGGDREAGTASSAVVITQDRYHPIPVRLDVLFDAVEGSWTLSSMSARLSDPEKLTHSAAALLWAPLWEAQQAETFADLASAGRTIMQLLDLQSVVDEKSESPVAAAFAFNYLLRSGDVDHLLDWPRDLANRFEWLPDGPVLWAETLLRRQEIPKRAVVRDKSAEVRDDRARVLRTFLVDPAASEAFEHFTRLAQRGAPLLASSLAIALRQAALWREIQDAGLLPGVDAYRLAQALENVDRAGQYAISAAGFSRFVASDALITPKLVLGARRRRAPRRRRAAEAAGA
jgi:hypothetical protein